MPLILSNNGEVIALSYLVNRIASPENLIYRLFTNNVVPSETDTAATFTEAVGGGYVAKTLTGATWNPVAGAPTQVEYPVQTWTFTGALTGPPTIYGYFITRATAGDLIGAENFAAYTPAAAGDVLNLTPRITAD